jgi:hypothetical protein
MVLEIIMTAPPPKTSLRQIEWVVAILATVAAGWLHFFYLIHAGGLWRDELCVKNIATLPSFGQVWEALPHDHCPILFLSLVRIWSATGLGTTDMGLRILGLGCGLLLLAAFWVASRTMNNGLPLLSLTFAGLNFTIIRYGDSIRAYGLATAFILLMMSLIWRFIETPNMRRGLLAGMVAVLSVQTLYQSAVFVLAVCIAGAAVCIRRRQQRKAIGVLSIGLPAALSLLPYVNPIRNAQSWWIVSQTGITLDIFLNRFHDASGGLIRSWLVLVILAALFGIGRVLIKTSHKETRVQQDLLLFASLALVIGLVGFGFFIKLTRLPTELWYYIPAMGFAVVCCDVIFSGDGFRSCCDVILPGTHQAARIGVLVVAVVVAALAFRISQSYLKWRQTNGDLVAAQVSKAAGPNDLIIVQPWHNGITFGHYYRGTAPWTTLPPLADYRFHRYDLIKAQLQMTNAIETVLKQVETTLRSGHNVWMVGQVLVSLRNAAPPADLSPAPNRPRGWAEQPYANPWSTRLNYLLVSHITNAVMLVDPRTNRVSPLENMPLTVTSGWRSPAQTNSP